MTVRIPDGQVRASTAPSNPWARGDYARLAREVNTGLGPVLVAACGVAPGQRVLDVAAGTGVAAIPAARAGGDVVAADFTPELLRAGAAEAADEGVALEWVEADAQDLPFDDGEFDVVMSCIGAMFAPDHQRTADELVRVCRPGGTLGMINWTPQGGIGEFFELFGRYAPPPPGTRSPALWGTEEHLRALFGDRVEGLQTREQAHRVDKFADPAEFCDYYKEVFGPVIAAYARVADDPRRVAALDREFLEFATRRNLAGPGRPASYEFEYLLAVGSRPGRG